MKECIIIGGGTSVLEGIEHRLWERIAKREIWSINFAFRTMPYLPKRQVWVDTTFFRNNMEDLESLSIAGVECHTKKHGIYNNIPAIIQHEVTREENNPDKLYIGLMGLSGMFALALATKEQYDTIYLLGYDFGTNSKANTTTHYYQNTDIKYTSNGVGNPGVYLTDTGVKKDVKLFDYFLKFPSKIYNVSPSSNIQSYEKITYNDFFSKIS
jgi:hypothetical protein